MREQEFQHLLRVVPAAVYACDLEGRLTYYNQRAVELWGRAPELKDVDRFCGSFRLYQLDGTLLPLDRSPMAEAVRTGRVPPANLEVIIERPNGSRSIVLVNIDVLRDQDGERIGAINCFQDITDSKRAEEELQQSEQLLRVVLDTLPVGVAVVDQAGDITLNNRASRRIWSGFIREGAKRYAESKGWWHATGRKVGPEEWPSRRALANGEVCINEVIDIETFLGERKITQNSAVPIRDGFGRITGAVVLNEDISVPKTIERELNDSYSQLRTLTARLLQAQDEERRNIARELHDSTGQNLIGLVMNLASLSKQKPKIAVKTRKNLLMSLRLAKQVAREISSISYLLHPPMLDDFGLNETLRWYVRGFSKRSGLRVTLTVGRNVGRLSREIEVGVFRIVQEGLTNVQRHSKGRGAHVSVERKGGGLTVEVHDFGGGLRRRKSPQPAYALGVGVAGMRERLQHLGGMLDIRSGSKGTVLRGTIPVDEKTA